MRMRLKHWGPRAGAVITFSLVLGACAADPVFFQVALTDDSVPLGLPGEEVLESARQIDVGQSAFGKYLAARHAEITGDFGSAADLMRGVLAEHGDNPAMLRRAHLLMVADGRFDDATDLATRIIAAGEVDPLASVTLAVQAASDGDFDLAGQTLADAPVDGTNQLLIPILRAWVLSELDDAEGGLQALTDLADNPGFALIADMHAGLIAAQFGDMDAAGAAFERAFNADSAPLRLTLGYAGFLDSQGRGAEAAEVLNAYAERQPDDLLVRGELDALAAGEALDPLVDSAADGMAEGLLGIARALNRDGSNIFSLSYTRMALELRPDMAIGQALLADILSGQGRNEEAIDVLAGIAPDSAYSWLGRQTMARLLESEDRLDEAVDLLTAMVTERPGRSEAAQALGDVLRVNDRFDEAVVAYDTAVDRVGDIGREHWRLLYTRGIALERSKQWPRAEKDFLTALELEPDQPLVLNYLGYSWVEQGVNFGRAREMIETAIEARPRDGFIIDSMGWVLYQFGKYDEAVEQLERAVALEPGDPVINDHLGDAYWLVGRQNEARFQWNRALGADPEDELRVILREKLSGRQLPQPQDSEGERDS